jgi:predicted phosphoadenosine phosphosulfate sulfurtransferase
MAATNDKGPVPDTGLQRGMMAVNWYTVQFYNFLFLYTTKLSKHRISIMVIGNRKKISMECFKTCESYQDGVWRSIKPGSEKRHGILNLFPSLDVSRS